MNVRTTALLPGSEERTQAVRAGIRAEVLTVGWMPVEAAIAIGAGLVARSVLLVAFGFDSVIELASGLALLWRLAMESSGRPQVHVERAERAATWAVAIALSLLCFYIVVSSGYGLVTRSKPDQSPAGIGLAVAALVVMPLLARTKRRIAWQLNSASLLGDAACSMTCAAMAGTMLMGLVLNAVLHWWWAEYLASLSFLYWLAPEARAALRAAFRGEPSLGCCDEGCGA